MVRLTPQLRKEMQRLAVQNERTLAAEVRVAVRQYLEREKGKESP